MQLVDRPDARLQLAELNGDGFAYAGMDQTPALHQTALRHLEMRQDLAVDACPAA
jgi:hypothetical protein